MAVGHLTFLGTNVHIYHMGEDFYFHFVFHLSFPYHIDRGFV